MAHERRTRQTLQADRDRAAALRILGRRANSSRRSLDARAAEVLDRHPAAERDRAAAHRPRAGQHAAGHPRALEADERLQHALASRHRPRRHRHADGRRARAGQSRASPASTSGARSSSRRSGSGRSRTATRSSTSSSASAPPPTGRASASRSMRASRAPSARLREALRRRPDLSRHRHGELVPALPHGDLRRRGRVRRAHREALPHRLSGRRIPTRR